MNGRLVVCQGGSSGGGGGGGDGDVLVAATHALELAAKLFLVVGHCAGAAPLVRVQPAWHARAPPLTVRVRAPPDPPAPAAAPAAPERMRIVRRGDCLDVLL